MKVATLQFSPRLGEVAANFSRAESLLMREEREGLLEGVDLLVLPELAFTGKCTSARVTVPYNFVGLTSCPGIDRLRVNLRRVQQLIT